MQGFLMILQIILSILLSLAILLQNRSAGLGSAFGGSGGFYVSKRGPEKILSNITLILMVLFLLNTLFILFI